MTVIHANAGTILLACPLLVRGYEPAFKMRHILCNLFPDYEKLVNSQVILDFQLSHHRE